MAEYAQITCLCGAVHEDGALIADEIPVRDGVDHCTDCRYTTGVVFHTAASLRHAPSDATVKQCTIYKSSAHMWRYFCSTCGTPCFLRNVGKDSWSIGTGIVEPKPGHEESFPPNVFIPNRHYFVGDSVDYKMASRLATVDGTEVPIWDGDDVGPPVAKQDVMSISERKGSVHDAHAEALEARCHCGKVDVRIAQPQWGDEPAAVIPPEPFRHKYRASFCVCRFCRLAVGGSSFAAWVYVPPSRIKTADGRDVTFSIRGSSLPELLDYESTPNQNLRCACKTCGARVFSWSAERPGIAVVAAGVLRAPEGSSAGNWLWWRNEMSFDEEHMDHEMWKALTNDEALQRTQ